MSIHTYIIAINTSRDMMTNNFLNSLEGGHGTIGYQLCKEIKAIAPNVEIAMLQVAACMIS